MSSDVFIVSTGTNLEAAAALQQALELAGLQAAHVQDVIFGVDGHTSQADLDSIAHLVAPGCPSATVSPGLRGLFYAATSILSSDAELLLVAVLDEAASSAFVLASPEAVGRLNLLPRARLAARSLTGQETALREAGISATEVEVSMEAGGGALSALLDEQERRPARWGMLTAGDMALLIERL